MKADKNKLGYVGSTPGSRKRDSDAWYTPKDYLDSVRKALGGHIDLDPCSCKEANLTVKAERFFSKSDDGLSKTWDAGTVFMNPPYSVGLCPKFVQKFVDEWLAGSFATGIVLVNNATETQWFQSLLDHAEAVCFTDHRISFCTLDGKHKSGNTRGQAFFYFGRNTCDFRREFSNHGHVIVMGRCG
jgi:site-specific DNA-methyltransferase (adenine-specific)